MDSNIKAEIYLEVPQAEYKTICTIKYFKKGTIEPKAKQTRAIHARQIRFLFADENV